MRHIVIIAALAALALTGCVRGSGNVVTREDSVSNFTQVEVRGRGGLIISQGDTESLVIEAEDNILKHIESRIHEGKLIIEHKNMLFARPTKPILYHLTVRDISAIRAVGAVFIEGVTPIHAENLELVVAGAGGIDLNVETEALSITLAGAGDMSLQGSARVFNAVLNGAGDVNALELTSQNAFIEAAGATSIELTVEQTLSVKASGACDVSYRGGAEIIEQEISGSNSIKRL